MGARMAATRTYAPLVREPLRFAARELSGRRAVGLYRPRGTNIRVCVRHNLRGPGWDGHDQLPLDEIFRERCYDPPAPVERRLAAIAQPRIVDLGGHLGYFGAYALTRYPDARLVSFEPEPDHARLLRRAIDVNGLADRWQLVEACAHTEDGTLKLAAGRAVGTHVVEPGWDEGTVVEVPARDALPHLEGADLAKIDVEGAEWALLLDGRFAAAPPAAVVMEYHSPGCPEENAKSFARRHLAELGYEVHVPADDPNPDSGPFWGRGLIWAWLPPTGGDTLPST
jgi:FkbM family methyltransferase